MSSGCTEILMDHVRNLSSSWESVGLLNTLLFDTYSFRKWICVLRSFVDADAIIASSILGVLVQTSVLKLTIEIWNSMEPRNVPRFNSETRTLGKSIIPLWEEVPPGWFNMPSPLWKCGKGIDVFTDSPFISLPGLFVVPVISALNSWEEDAKSFEIVEECGRSSFLSRWSFKNVSCGTRTIVCTTRQSRIATRQSSGTQNCRGLTGNVGRSRAAPWFRFVKISCVWQGIYFVL